MIVQVVPVKRGAISLPFFDYSIPKNLESIVRIGQLVSIPLRKREEFGIIIKILTNDISKFKNIKEIISIVHTKPFFSSCSINFFVEMSELYHCSLGSIIKTSLLPLKKRKLTKIQKDLPLFPIADTKFAKPSLLVYKNIEEKISYIKDKVGLHNQILIIVPEIIDANQLFELLPKEYSSQAEIITSEISEKESFDQWIKIWTGDTKIIIGTRNSVFLPFFSLSDIIVDQAFHSSHKSWDAAPRFQSKDAALILAKHLGAQLSFLTHTPSVEEYFFEKNNVYTALSNRLPILKRQPSIINQKQEFRAKNYSTFSLPLQDAINEHQTGTIFLFCNRKGSASYVSCRDCSKVLKCDKCSRPYIYYERFSELKCHHCSKTTKMTASCSSCDGVNLAFYGAGTSGIASEFKKIFPNDKRKVYEVDKSATNLNPSISESNCIIVGTQFAWPHVNWKDVSVMAMMDADTPLYTPEYLGGENLWFSIHDAIFRLPQNSPLFIQTRHDDHPVYESLSQPENFYKQELSDRKMFGYPPYQYLLKLFLVNENKTFVEASSNKLYFTLLQLTKNSSDIKINRPLTLFPNVSNGLYSQALIIKLSYKNYKKSLKLILANTPDDWKADPNPINLLSL